MILLPVVRVTLGSDCITSYNVVFTWFRCMVWWALRKDNFCFCYTVLGLEFVHKVVMFLYLAQFFYLAQCSGSRPLRRKGLEPCFLFGPCVVC